MHEQTLYTKLLPPASTPADERCQCVGTPVKLMSALSYNPIHCMNCNLEVSLDTLALSEELVEVIAQWRDVYNAIDLLWLDSRSYETWARAQLADITSEANTRGRSTQHMLNTLRRCYYWHFQDQSAATYDPIRVCPVCSNALDDYRQGIFLQRVCEQDSIVVSGV